jgi:hypothetical protein
MMYKTRRSISLFKFIVICLSLPVGSFLLGTLLVWLVTR